MGPACSSSHLLLCLRFFSLLYLPAFKCQTQCEEQTAFPWELQDMVQLSVLPTFSQVYRGDLATVSRKTSTMIRENNLYTVNVTNVIYLLSALLQNFSIFQWTMILLFLHILTSTFHSFFPCCTFSCHSLCQLHQLLIPVSFLLSSPLKCLTATQDGLQNDLEYGRIDYQLIVLCHIND